ncbi:hypothetical protein BU23DRAFT_174822 [Bimuria novae-zelandiae CBS 107.79]|uniref:Uncharacterized protein n=1 Tax=Bimuria novae-zelandiae CBS 107.79 TaxID=1447943 RepID=A0A6A5VA18_9PLEO|nr:hypothetical protein BU23DRAFT_174822 [Bimuria novae-zelandiae CBS 107.79]
MARAAGINVRALPLPCLLYMHSKHVARRLPDMSVTAVRVAAGSSHLDSSRRTRSSQHNPAARMHQGNAFTLSRTLDNLRCPPLQEQDEKGRLHALVGREGVFASCGLAPGALQPRMRCNRCVVKSERGISSPAHQRHLSSFEKIASSLNEQL